MTPLQTTPQVPMGSHRPSQQYGIPPPPPPPTYRLSPYTSPHQPRKPLARSADELLSPPRKRQAVDPTASGKPSLAPIQTGSIIRMHPTSHELRPGYSEPRLITPHSDYGQRSPPYSGVPSPQRRRESIHSSASTIPLPPPTTISLRSAEISPYTLLPPPSLPRSPIRTAPVQTRRYSYQPHTPYSPEQAYSARPISQGGLHMPSPMSAAPLPPPPLAYNRTSPVHHYAPVPSSRLPTEYLDRPTITQAAYDYREISLPPLAHLNRDTPPIPSATTTTPARPSPIPVSLPPPSGLITAPRNPRDSAILSAFDTVSKSPSSSRPPERTPTPGPSKKL